MIKKQKDWIIFGLSASKEIAADISEKIGVFLGKTIKNVFIDGEILIRSEISVRNKNIIVIQSTNTTDDNSINDNLMELLIFIDALKRASAASINIVCPYFGYARQDRKVDGRQPITAKMVADLIEKVGATRITFFDIHAEQIQGFFNIPVDALKGLFCLAKYLKKKYQDKKIVFVAPDQGSVKFTRIISDQMNKPVAIIDKRRVGINKVKSYGILGNVKDKICIVVDDIIDSAGTIHSACKILKKSGAKEIIICGIHGLFNKNALKRLSDPIISEVIVTNTVNLKKGFLLDKLKVIKINNFLGEVLLSQIENKSISLVYKKYSNYGK